jgi:hypothetical protein
MNDRKRITIKPLNNSKIMNTGIYKKIRKSKRRRRAQLNMTILSMILLKFYGCRQSRGRIKIST